MRIAVISPFLDRRHGTERVVSELLERIARDHNCEIHLYSQRVEDILLTPSDGKPQAGRGSVRWHRVVSVPGPHLIQYLWWFAANTLQRWWDVRSGKLSPDLVFSPGINAWDADVIQVHIVFEEFYQRVKAQLVFRDAPLASWPRLLHRRLYYGLIRWLENCIYRRKQVYLAGVSRMVVAQLATHFGRYDAVSIPNGVDITCFEPQARLQRRSVARASFNLSPDTFVLLLIGNDWRNKGLQTLIEVLDRCRDLRIQLLVVGIDDVRPFEATIQTLGIPDRIRFLPPSEDVMQFYAAADAYACPSLEDAYGLPVIEAMACGLPVITSINAGVSEVITDGLNGLLLRDPTNAVELAGLIRRLISDPSFMEKLAGNAVSTARQCTLDDNAVAIWELLNKAVERRRGS
ncbi:MAG TPA: glycosyltransferase family 4 protein [Candidatus Dormibacteraeota bacterium]|nr:glycosyltransferase family 4 protein [Candidatus Dormibacteraeota bacterium]